MNRTLRNTHSTPRATRAAFRAVAYLAAALSLCSLTVVSARAEQPATPATPAFWTGNPDSSQFRARMGAELKAAQDALDRLLAVKGGSTVENTLTAYNEALIHADNAAYQSSLIEYVHPDSAMRGVAEEIDRAANKFLSDMSLNRAVYDAIVKMRLKGADQTTRYCVSKMLRDFRLAGVDKDEATRKKIAAIREEMVQIGQDFGKNIRDDTRTVQVDGAVGLAGLPEDYIAAHKPGADGKVTVTTEYPDFFPVMKYARNSDLRRNLLREFLNRAYPVNMAVLDKLIAKRYELAQLLGFRTWAEYVTKDKMVENDKNVADFIERLRTVTYQRAKEESDVYLKRKREDDPNATVINQWERSYYGELIRKRDYNFDSQQARPYFPFKQVKQGLLDVTSQLFGVRYKRLEGAAVWHPSVEAYEMYDGDRLIGRFYLDLNPRPGKYSHAANFGIRNGVEGIQIPEGALVCNFPGGDANDPGLMEHAEVVTFFHEFGHLMHSMFAGHQRWEPISGLSMEWDFVEAPSQMLEEWCWRPQVLQTFAKHYQTGAPISAEMVDRMRKADRFGRATQISYQTLFSAMSLNYYNRPPSEVNTDDILRQLEPKYSPYPPMPDTHFQASFGHLDGYSAIYYTYMWSLAISKDMFSKFDHENLLDPAAAKLYRDRVLAPGGSAPAATLVRAFLGRDYNDRAFDAWLSGND